MNVVNKEYPVQMDCPTCGGAGVLRANTDEQAECDQCDGMGRFDLDECPRKYIGQDLTECINYAAMASKGVWPVSGGLLDQSAWFVSLVQRLEAEMSIIDTERMSRI